MLEQRLIGTTVYSIYDDLPEFLETVDKSTPQRVFASVENGSGKYELIAGYMLPPEAHLYLAPNPLAETSFRKQQEAFQRRLSGASVVEGRIEVGAAGELLQSYRNNKDWASACAQECPENIHFVSYNGSKFIAFQTSAYFFTTWRDTIPQGAFIQVIGSYSDLGV